MSNPRFEFDRQQMLFVANVFNQLLSLEFKKTTARHVDAIRDIERIANNLSADNKFNALSGHLGDSIALLFRLDNPPVSDEAGRENYLKSERKILESQMSAARNNNYITTASVAKLKLFLPTSHSKGPDALFADQVVFCLCAIKLMVGLYSTGDSKSAELDTMSTLLNKYVDDVAKKQRDHKLSTQTLGAINSVLLTNLKTLVTLPTNDRTKELLLNLQQCATRADAVFQALLPENKVNDVVMSNKILDLLERPAPPSVAAHSFYDNTKPDGSRHGPFEPAAKVSKKS